MGKTANPCWTRSALWGSLLGLLLAFAVEILHVTAGPNFHAVLPGRVYRSAQPSERQLEQMVAGHGIRTLINLRGVCEEDAWYHREKETAARLGVRFVDVGLWASLPPDPKEMRQFVRALDDGPYPVLIHCQQGGDRTGLASALVLLLQTDAGLAEAKGQLSLRYGHYPYGRAAVMDRFLVAYEHWLGKVGLAHSPANLRRWIDRMYTETDCAAPSLPR
jgi:protein tyrosine/serine phosphatase